MSATIPATTTDGAEPEALETLEAHRHPWGAPKGGKSKTSICCRRERNFAMLGRYGHHGLLRGWLIFALILAAEFAGLTAGLGADDVAHTPWWILAGVMPQGPSIDMGTYKMSSFSKSQQEQFGVNQHGQITDFSRFTSATAALAPCTEPHERQNGLNETQMMRLLGHALDVGWRQVQLEDVELQQWMARRSECQRSCMVKVIGITMKTLWAIGEFSAHADSTGQGAFAKALGDAVRSCYPGFRALNIDGITQKVAIYVGQQLMRIHPHLAVASGFGSFGSRRLAMDVEPCLSGNDAQRDVFVDRMTKAVNEAVEEARRRSWQILEHDARPCQRSCHDSVLKHTVETLWDSGLLSLGNSDALALTALQGAISSCFAKLPEQEAAELAGEALVRFQHPMATKAAAGSMAVAPVPEPAVDLSPGLYGDCTRSRRCSGQDVKCYEQNQFFAQCLRKCPEHWDCNSPRSIHT
eukprot:s763_g13.t1